MGRLATADAAGTHLAALVFAVDGDQILSVIDDKPGRFTGPADANVQVRLSGKRRASYLRDQISIDRSVGVAPRIIGANIDLEVLRVDDVGLPSPTFDRPTSGWDAGHADQNVRAEHR